MLNFLKKIFPGLEQSNTETKEHIDLNLILNQIAEAEKDQPPEPGKKIHSFLFKEFHIRLDMDITRSYRITVFRGQEKIYSFSVFCESGSYEKLETAFSKVIHFLQSERNLSQLPDDNSIKGHYFGTS